MVNTTYNFFHHTEIHFGPGIIKDIGNEAKAYGSRALIVCDQGVVNAGIVSKVTQRLDEVNIPYVVYDKVKANPRDTGCEEAAKAGNDFKADLVIGIGGGSAMDSAKAANVLMTNGGTCEGWATLGSFEQNVFPMIAVPTTAGTGSEVTFEAVITISRTSTKMSVLDGKRLAPILAIMDPELTVSVPPLVTASTGMDALTHALEAYTCSYAHPISDSMALYAMKKIAGSIVEATQNGANIDARSDMLLGSLLAGIAFTNSFLGAVHSLSERIGGFYDTPHGIANSIFLPFVTEFNKSSDYDKHAEVANCLGVDITGMSKEEASAAGVRKIFEMNDVLGIPKFRDISNVNPDDFEKIAESCVSHMCTMGNPRPIDKADYLEILLKAYALK